MTNVKDMTRGSPLSLILTFAFPLMIGNVFQQFYTVVDTMVVGKPWAWTRWQLWAPRTGCTGWCWV